MNFKRLALIVVIFSPVFGLSCVAPANSSTTSSSMAPAAPAPPYTVFDKTDNSVSGKRRFIFYVQAAPPLSKDDVMAIAQNVVQTAIKTEKIWAIVVRIYDDNARVKSSEYKAQLLWAPEGSWPTGLDNPPPPGDYTRHKLVLEYGPPSSVEPRPAQTQEPATPTQTPQTIAARSSTTAPITQDGTYLVGVDVAPGIWRAEATSRNCYWARFSGATILGNSLRGAPGFSTIVEIRPTDPSFRTEGCGTWKLNNGPITTDQNSAVGDGTYIIGQDMAFGTWVATGAGNACLWARLKDFNGNEVLERGINKLVVTISPSDVGFSTWGCGQWRRR